MSEPAVNNAFAEVRELAAQAYNRVTSAIPNVAALDQAADVAFNFGREMGAGDMERIERHARADELEAAAAGLLARANRVRANVGPDPEKRDVISGDGTHEYWSTHCRHDRHDDCTAKWLTGPTVMDGVTTSIARRPAQCKTCAAPCICPCHVGVEGG